ncbi:hypothetical protein OUY22_04890 [Nonomuraea sp. MCN248]|uniref:Uncharacterized protein n=1 Tax=Nonomuraea corallina TaxID=2989783 RepID=A0ABT4S6B7_9ACTN|nr:hypothetical protein [Nonomuraea corallina]MDA0632744.1 hypothetical protein [Nonomuraea corallina]
MTLAAHLLDLAARHSPLVRDTLRRLADAPLADLLAGLRPGRSRPWQDRDDLCAAVADLTARSYGHEVAAEVAADLRAQPIVPTSNHFGVDTFADSVQGTLLFALRPGAPRTVVVLGFGSVSLNNLTYPMGLRLYDPRHGELDALPQRLPVQPNRDKHRTVLTARPFDAGMIERAQARLARMRRAGEVSAFCARSADDVLHRVYGAPETLALPSHGLQATRVNTALWRGLFQGEPPARLVQVAIEPICAALLESDLNDPGSLIHQLFFVPQVREALLDGLDGERACWERSRSRGTVFFWGLGAEGRRVPLTLHGELLTGVDERGRRLEWKFSPEGLAPALRAGLLLPSLFTCFATLAFARGLSCVGGYYQATYLPVMQRGVVAALGVGEEFRDLAGAVAQVSTGLHLASLQAAARSLPGGAIIPAGPVEIAGAGGLSPADVAALTRVPVREAHVVAFPDVLDHLVPAGELPPGWAARLALESGAARAVRLETP